MKRSSTTREIGPTARLVESRKTSLAVDSVPVRTTSSRNTGSPVFSCALAPDNSRETSLCAAAVAPISCCACAEVARPIRAPIMRQKQQKQLVRCIFWAPQPRRYDLTCFAIHLLAVDRRLIPLSQVTDTTGQTPRLGGLG